ncbi:PAS domain S-box protein [Planococcus beigongshangi]|uniref:PAS domain S-box protein n=1 Tax=Planococcus beigongshangi TaxID=2782536 RepID=UPI00193B1FD1|nr:PAS domain S-box protein [Planococcus beigongshangi]
MDDYNIEKSSQDISGYTALLNIMKDPVFLMEKDEDSFRYVYANPSSFALLSSQDLIGRRIDEIFPPDQIEEIIPYYLKVMAVQKPVEFTKRIRTENGDFFGETMLNPILTEEGECQYILAIVRDVTERELKKEDLLKTQREMEIERLRLRSLIENNANAVFEFDQEKKFTRINKMVAESTGYSEEELIGQSILFVVTENCMKETVANFDKSLAGHALDFETTIWTKTQQLATFQLNTVPIIVEGAVIGIYVIAKEITEQKEMEQRLLESEQRYKALFENHPHGILTFDREGELLSINAGAENILGYTIQDFKSRPFLSFILPSETETIQNHFYKAIHEKKPAHSTLEFRHKNGELIILQAMNVPIIADGKLVGIHGIVSDVTEIHTAQQALSETKKELEVFWENSTDPIFYIDTKGDILKVNPAFEKTFGFTEEEMVAGKGTIIPQGMQSDQFRVVEKILKGETINSHDTIRITKSGKRLNIISSYSPVWNADKEVIGATIIYKDVTELKKAEKELQKSQEKYKIITESTFDVITMVNMDGLVEYVSPAYETITGYRSEDCIGTSLLENVHPEDAETLIESVKSLIAGGKPATIEIRFRHQQGHYLWMEVSPTPVLENGEVKQVFTISRDITERRELQEEIARMAYYDHLTGIPNRRTFDDKLEKALNQAQTSGKKVAVIMLDGHKFKQINDQFGHDAGDAVIREMALRLEQCVYSKGTAARLGGDEMSVILPEIDSLDEAEDMAIQILKSYEPPILFNGAEIKISVGIGIALYPDHSTNEKQLIKSADTALYEAKKSGIDAYRIYGLEEVQEPNE